MYVCLRVRLYLFADPLIDFIFCVNLVYMYFKYIFFLVLIFMMMLYTIVFILPSVGYARTSGFHDDDGDGDGGGGGS